jgi:hypothetical protein
MNKMPQQNTSSPTPKRRKLHTNDNTNETTNDHINGDSQSEPNEVNSTNLPDSPTNDDILNEDDIHAEHIERTHPYGVQPLGNWMLNGGPNGRDLGLGVFARLPDELILEVSFLLLYMYLCCRL